MKFYTLTGLVLSLIAGNLIFDSHAQSSVPRIIQIQAQFAADFFDDRILMGGSHNVFVGKVIRQVGNKERGIGPETQFEVEVIDNIKGELEGTVVVNQEGGLKDGVQYVVGDGEVLAKANGNDYLLQPGETYLLATRYNGQENWFTLNFHPNASKLISDEKNVGKEELKELAANDKKVRKLKSAYEKEIPLEADIKNDNVRNSFKSFQDKLRVKEDIVETDASPVIPEIAEPNNLGSEPLPQQSAGNPDQELSPTVESKETVKEDASIGANNKQVDVEAPREASESSEM